MYEVDGDGILHFRFHRGQRQAWKSERRFVAVLAGTQGGKTSWIPWWLYREIRRRGPGDYIAATASYDLFKLRMLPSLREVFEDVLGWGRYWAGARLIELADPATGRFLARHSEDPMWGRIILRSAESGGGLESATAKAAVLDEAGQKSFTQESWFAILRRLSLNLGRALIATTLYNFDWLKTEVYDRWKAGDPDYDVIQFDSTDNPVFPEIEWRRAQATMPGWKFDMQYRGVYARPAGLIYDCFRDAPSPFGHIIPRQAVPHNWPRFLGLDFGGVNTAGLFLARDPATGTYHAYRDYHAGERTAREHARALLEGEPVVPTCVGGSPSEGQWRAEFAAAGLPVYPPDVRDVEIGIGRVYGALKSDAVLIQAHLEGTLKELRSYSRKLDAAGQPTDVIEDKSRFHRLDAARYILGWLFRTAPDAALRSVANPFADRRWGT